MKKLLLVHEKLVDILGGRGTHGIWINIYSCEPFMY